MDPDPHHWVNQWLYNIVVQYLKNCHTRVSFRLFIFIIFCVYLCFSTALLLGKEGIEGKNRHKRIGRFLQSICPAFLEAMLLYETAFTHSLRGVTYFGLKLNNSALYWGFHQIQKSLASFTFPVLRCNVVFSYQEVIPIASIVNVLLFWYIFLYFRLPSCLILCDLFDCLIVYLSPSVSQFILVLMLTSPWPGGGTEGRARPAGPRRWIGYWRTPGGSTAESGRSSFLVAMQGYIFPVLPTPTGLVRPGHYRPWNEIENKEEKID